MRFDQVKPAPGRLLFQTIFLALLLTATSGYSFSALYAFGDSLSDTGRSPAPSPSYYDGRFSNGSLWVEYLSAQLGLAYDPANNFAVSGSVTSDLASEIAGVSASTNLQTALFTIWSGGNDFLNYAMSAGINDASWNSIITTAVMNLTNAVGALYAKGAREILVCNLPNLGRIPAASAFPSAYQTYVGSKVVAFNTTLASALTAVMQRNLGLRIYPVDMYSRYNAFLSTPAAYGFTVTTIGALDDPAFADKSFTGPGQNYVFWDSIHPTTKGHALIAATAFQSVGVQLSSARSGTNLTLGVRNLSPNLTYTIQTSTNLFAWSDYQTFTATGTNANVVLTNGPGGRVFYRVRY
ncbi:MAG: hypothetical protein JWQ04_2064 [Pedosphaera sp.]|nr:hypothetical protein [Pedosphaera sp.]